MPMALIAVRATMEINDATAAYSMLVAAAVQRSRSRIRFMTKLQSCLGRQIAAGSQADLGTSFSCAEVGQSGWKADQADLAPVIGLAEMGGAAETEEAVGVGISVEVDRLHLLDSGGEKPVADVGRKVEMRLP